MRKKVYVTGQDARGDVFDYIKLFYNSRRRHGFNNLLSPVEFEKRYTVSLESARQTWRDATHIHNVGTLCLLSVISLRHLNSPLTEQNQIGSRADEVGCAIGKFAAKKSEKQIVPGVGCSTVTSPPCNCMIAVTMARPSP